MREVYKIIASALIFSKDNKLLMGRKYPTAGGIYTDCWHIPGGSVNEGESLKDAVIREIKEEIGLDISDSKIILLPYGDSLVSEKTLKESGEKVLCHMEVSRFKISINKNASDIVLQLTDNLIEIKWFNLEELSNIKHAPLGKKFLQKMGCIK